MALADTAVLIARQPAPRQQRRGSFRAFAWQGLFLCALALFAWFVIANASDNLAARNMNFGFAFLSQRTGFDIPFHVVPWSTADSYGRALWVCLLNTLLAAAIGIVLGSLLGFLLGVMRLSANWLARSLSLAIIEIVRNTPQLLQIIFWYVVMIQALPPPRNGLALPGGMILSVRGLNMPSIEMGTAGLWPFLLLVAALCLAPVFRGLRRRHRAFGWAAPLLPAVALMLVLLSIDHIDYPTLRGFNYVGGVVVPPELIALVGGLSLYMSAFVAEIVRASLQGIARGQREAASSLGLSGAQALFLVILPQALRVMIPQLTNQYLNLTKSTSLGAAIAYPELVQIYAGTVLNQTGRALETMFLVMIIFLGINLVISGFMAWYNAHVAIVER